MSLEPNPLKATDAAIQGGGPVPPEDNPGFWFELIDERVAGAFVDLTPRTLQAYRQRGGGPRFCRVSSRCIKYRRFDLRQWSESLLRTSTADNGREAA